jgi:Fe-S oxidoreductase
MTAKSIVVLIAFLVSLGVFGYRVYRRYEHMRLGQPAGPFTDWGARIKALGVFVLGQRRLFRLLKPGTAHFFIFWGFLLLFPTIVQAILEGVYPGFALPIIGTFGPVLLLQDLVALAVIIAVLYGLYLRVIVKPDRYRGSHQAEGTLVLCFILLIMMSLLGMNGILRNLGEAPVAQNYWQPASTLFGLPFAGLDEQVQLVLYEVFYWIHLGVVLVFLMMLPGGKHFHVVTSIFSVLLGNLEPRGKLPPAPHFDGVAGVKNIEQFTWRQMLDWYSCTECGRCQDVCPAYASGLPLSPKLLVMELRAHLYERGNALQAKPGNGARQAVLDQELTVDVIPEDVLWACTTCYACDQECPLLIEHIPEIIDMRRYLLTQQRADAMLTGTLANLRRYGNSFGKSAKQRAMWTRPIKPKIKDIRREAAHTLWFVGDYASYSPALTDISQTTAKVFRQAGLDFGILYDAERNAGNDVRRVGEEGLFELLMTKNKAVLGKCQFEEIVTTDPHTYHTLKKEYGLNGQGPPVHHYTELLDRMISSGQLTPKRRLDYSVTYHDPCYLGRYNGIYDAPRRVLEAIGCRVVEMPRNRDRALCCGAGGGRIWMEEGDVTERPAEARIREAAALDGEVQNFVVACPKDITMFKDAVKATGHEDRLVVKDLIELVDESLEV